MKTVLFCKVFSDYAFVVFQRVHIKARLCVKLCPPAALDLHMMFLCLSFSALLLTSSVSVSPLLSFLSHLFVLSSSVDARCGKGRQWFGAEIYWGDVGRGAQPSTNRAADTHGRGQSLHISVELILRVCLFSEREPEQHPSILKSMFFSFPVWASLLSEWPETKLSQWNLTWCPWSTPLCSCDFHVGL